MKKIHRIQLVLALLLASGLSHAQAPDALQARSLAASCAACHGTDGRAEPGMVSLAGVPQDQLVRKMLDYKTGRMPATIMHQLAKGYSDEQITAIAAYFAAQKN